MALMAEGAYGRYTSHLVLEMYFLWINRYGLPRIEAGMWMAAMAVVLYGMSEDIGRMHIGSRKWIVVLSGIIFAMNLTTFHENRELEEISTELSRNFFELVSADQEKLYTQTSHIDFVYAP